VRTLTRVDTASHTTSKTTPHGNQARRVGHSDCDAVAPGKLLSVCVRRGRAPKGIYCCTFGHSRAWVVGGGPYGHRSWTSGQAKGQGRGWASTYSLGSGAYWGRAGCTRGAASGRSFPLGRRVKEGPGSSSKAVSKAGWRTLWPGWPHS
jgi:hypothetical protein